MHKTAELPVAQSSADRTPHFEVADMIVAYLEQLGVEYIFGIPGGAIEPLYNAMARSQRRGGLRPVLARHEAGAAFMADGYARETGKIGVCCATSGPGATNLVTGIACSFDNGVPVLAITGQPALPSFGKRPFQESGCTGVNTIGMFRHCTRYNSLVSHRDQIENKLVNAMMRAFQPPQGPVHLSIPVDVLRSPAKRLAPAYDLKTLLHKPSMVDDVAVRELCVEIRRSSNLVFIIGGGCGEAVEAILELIELTGATFITTPDGKGMVNPRHRAYRGVFGFAGHHSANDVLRSTPDLIMAIGTNLGEWTSGAWSDSVLNERLVHIDPSDEHLMRSPMARLHVRGRIRTVCERLIELLRADGAEPPQPAVVELLSPESIMHEPDKFSADTAPLKPQRLMRELPLRCPPHTRFVADTGNSTAWAVHYLNLRDRRFIQQHDYDVRNETVERRGSHAGWLRVIMDFAPMGWAIGAAIGIAQGAPDCPVVCITGDGSYLMNGQEITVALVEELTVLFVVLNDRALGMVKHGQRLSGAEAVGYELPAVNFRLMAEAMGVPGYEIFSVKDLDRLDFAAMLRRKGPTLLDVHIDPEEIPPMNLRIKALTQKK